MYGSSRETWSAKQTQSESDEESDDVAGRLIARSFNAQRDVPQGREVAPAEDNQEEREPEDS